MFIRSASNPIIRPDEKSSWWSKKVYNPTVLLEDGSYHLFFRAVGRDGQSRIGRAISSDGESFSVAPKPALEPASAIDRAGVEDPRIVRVDSEYFLTYTAYDGHAARLALAISDNLVVWKKIGPILPDWDIYSAGGFSVAGDAVMGDEAADANWSKAGAIFPEVVNGEYLMLFGDRDLWLARSADGRRWQTDAEFRVAPRPVDHFDSLHLEMGPPPIRTEEGWLVIYHGIDAGYVYRLGYLLLDIEDPTRILRRSRLPIFSPEESYELGGLIDLSAARKALALDKTAKISENKSNGPRVVFCCGACVTDGRLRIYYGAGDRFVCTASARLKDVLNSK